jgi:hypothetical protein
VEFRKEWAEKAGFGFTLPSVVPNVPNVPKKRVKLPSLKAA